MKQINNILNKIISIVQIIALIAAFTSFSIVLTSASSETDRINQQIRDTYSAALKIFKQSYPDKNSFDGWCGAYVRDQLLVLDIISSQDSDVSGNGNKMYGNTKSGTTSKGYVKEKFGGNNCLSDIVNKYGNNVYNIFVSWTHQYGYSNSSPGAGHVVFIHAIIDGRLYFSESYDSSYGKEGTPQNCTISDFMRRYNNSYGNAIGAVLFKKPTEITVSTDYVALGLINHRTETVTGKITGSYAHWQNDWDGSIVDIDRTINNGEFTWKITAKAAGTTDLILKAQDDNYNTIVEKKIRIIVTDDNPKITVSTSSVSLGIRSNRTQTVTGKLTGAMLTGRTIGMARLSELKEQ